MILFFKVVAFIAVFLLILSMLKSIFTNPKIAEVESNDDDLETVKDESERSDFDGNVAPKKILTPSEIYNLERILSNLPDGVMICPQVSFNAFIDCKQMTLRNRFNRKSVDYLLVDEKFNPLLVVECDDDSHSSKKVRMRDLQRDQIAAAAGIPTLRITNKTPTEELGSLIRDHIKYAA